DCPRLEWTVLDWNTPAIEFYRAKGALPQDEWTTQRVTGAALQALARR
ncbi:N-acetyltransferase, partial [bacterium LRH843]|nr:N-acetyltransferase [bacterium LRH843]